MLHGPADAAHDCIPGVVVIGLVLHPLTLRQVVAIHHRLPFNDDEVEAVVASDDAVKEIVHRLLDSALEHDGHWF